MGSEMCIRDSIYAAGFVTFAVESLVVFGFYALSNTKLPVKVGIFGVILDIILAVTLIAPFGFAAIAWAYVFSKTVKVIILLLVMNRKFRFFHDSEFIHFILAVTVSCIVSAFCLNLLNNLNPDSSFLQKFIFDLAIPAAGFATVFWLCCRLFKIEELKLLSAILLRKKSLKSELTEDIL